MGRKEWPDDWKVGNEAAWGCLIWPFAIVAGMMIGFILRNWPW